MTITHAKYGADGSVTAGPIEIYDEIKISGTDSRFWPMVQAWVDAGNVIEQHVEPDVEPPALAPLIYAIAHLTVDSGAISSITPSARIGGAFYIDVGVYWVFFATPQPDTEYIPLCYNHSHNVTVSDRYEDFFVVTAELDGLPSDPPSFSVEIKRVN